MPHKGYDTSFQNALEQLKLLDDPQKHAARCGVNISEQGLELAYFGTPCAISLPQCNFEPDSLSLGEKILILHYITSEGELEQDPDNTTFQSLHGGMFYFSTFRKRGPNRVLGMFGENASLLSEVAEKEGWSKGALGDVSVMIPALPMVHVEVVLHEGDDEFPPEVQFLFRRDILSFFPLEDVAVLGGIVATKLSISSGIRG